MIITAAVPAPAISSDDTGSAEPDGDSAPDPNSQLARKTGNVTKAHPVSLRVPTKKDGQAIHRLIKQCPPLDLNSVYTYLLLCEHFQQTCVVAEVDHQLYGFVSAYIHPYHADVLFVWQVAVHERARGMGLGKRMLNSLLGRPSTKEVRYVETTVGPDNVPSRRMFHALATDCGAQVQESPLFESELFGPGGHDDECLLRIGPITRKIIQEQTHEN